MSPSIFKSKPITGLKSLLSNSDNRLAGGWQAARELFRGVDHQRILYWEDNQPALYDYVSVNGNAQVRRIDDNSHAGSFYEDAIVLISGPQVYQRIFKLEVEEDQLPEWIINNRHRIWPAGIDEESLDFSYIVLDDTAGKYVYFCFTDQRTLISIAEYCTSKGIVPSRILPRAALIFNRAINLPLAELADSELNRGGIKEILNFKDDQYRISARPSDNGHNDLPRIIIPDQDGAKTIDITTAAIKNLAGDKSRLSELNLATDSIFKYSASLLGKAFKITIYAILSVMMILVLSNIYLTVRESKSSGVLAELEIMQSNSRLLENKVKSLETELSVYSNLLAQHSGYGKIIAELSAVAPDSLWCRYIEIIDKLGSGNEVEIKGYTVAKAQVAGLASALESLPEVKSVDINSLNLITENIPDDIPSRFHDSLYRYSLQLEVR